MYQTFFQKYKLTEFENGDDAYHFIINANINSRKIDLLITDINHPGLRGHELVKSIRYYEKLSHSPNRIPIMILSMVEESRYPELVAENFVDSYLIKSTEPEDIIEAIEHFLYT